MALGASPGTMMQMVLRQGLALAVIGAGIGLVVSLLVSRVLSKLLYETAPSDPLTFGVSALVLVLVASAACWLPARRASRIDPILALRQD